MLLKVDINTIGLNGYFHHIYIYTFNRSFTCKTNTVPVFSCDWIQRILLQEIWHDWDKYNLDSRFEYFTWISYFHSFKTAIVINFCEIKQAKDIKWRTVCMNNCLCSQLLSQIIQKEIYSDKRQRLAQIFEPWLFNSLLLVL